jgi:AraC-like DNA-binding protein
VGALVVVVGKTVKAGGGQLLLQGASVTEAALLASYGSPANFATAFRRQYGVCPRNLRR